MKNNLISNVSNINTPAFLYVEPFHSMQIQKFMQKTHHKNNNIFFIYYSVKTNDSRFVLDKIANAVDGLEVISLRELEMAHSIPNVKKIIVNGPCKTEKFLNQAINYNAYIYIDNEDEFYLLEKILKERNECINVGLRLMYGNNANDQKFGIKPLSGFYNKLLSNRNNYQNNINITGLHSHVSSYEESYDEFHHRIADMKIRVNEFQTKGFMIKNINIGGGFEPVVRLNHSMDWEIIDDFDKKRIILDKVLLSDLDFLLGKSIFIEPGRALSESAIVGVGEVVSIKKTKEIAYVFMNFSTAFAGGSHPAESCIKMLVLEKNTNKLYPLEQDSQSKTLLCGPLCSGSDNFGFYSGKKFCIGDRILLLNAGAYTLSFRWHGPDKLPEITYFSEACK